MNKKDFKIETFRATGNGGQNVNKLETGVRITHLPTGLSASCQDERHQGQNKRRAFKVLLERIEEHEQEQKKEAVDEIRSKLYKGRVRTYNMITGLVTDNVLGVKVHGAQDVLDGHLELLRK